MRYYISHSVRVERTRYGFCRCEFFQDSPFRLPLWAEREHPVAVFTYFDVFGAFQRVSPLILGVSLESDVASDVIKFSSTASERRRPHNIRVKLRA